MLPVALVIRCRPDGNPKCRPGRGLHKECTSLPRPPTSHLEACSQNVGIHDNVKEGFNLFLRLWNVKTFSMTKSHHQGLDTS